MVATYSLSTGSLENSTSFYIKKSINLLFSSGGSSLKVKVLTLALDSAIGEALLASFYHLLAYLISISFEINYIILILIKVKAIKVKIVTEQRKSLL